MRITAFTRYGRGAASTRQRFLQYFPALAAAGIHVEHRPLLADEYMASLVDGRDYGRGRVAADYGRRLAQLATARQSDLYWIYVELLPFVPALVELLAVAGKPVVYDFDDAFFHAYDQSPNPLVRATLSGKHAKLLRNAAACCCGNDYLRNFAIRHCRNSIVLPTVVDSDRYRPVPRQAGPLTIGWIGSPSTWSGVRPILPMLKRMVAAHDARFLVVGAGREAAADAFDGMDVKDWSEAEEISDVQRMDIGIMPMLDRPFERGKSGYKLVQYMACGLPVVASPIGVNAQIVKEGVNGRLASTAEQWTEALASLLGDAEGRRKLGAAGREQVVAQFSLESQKDRLVALFQSLA